MRSWATSLGRKSAFVWRSWVRFEHRNDLGRMIRELPDPVGKVIRGDYETVVTSGNASAAREALSTYMRLNGYRFTIPTDPTVHFALDSGRHVMPKVDL